MHTGDVRAESSFLTSLARNPWLQRYIPPSVSFFDSANAIGDRPLRTLDAIYLDTACLLSHYDIPSKVRLSLPNKFTHPYCFGVLKPNNVSGGSLHRACGPYLPFATPHPLFHKLLDLGIRGYFESHWSRLQQPGMADPLNPPLSNIF